MANDQSENHYSSDIVTSNIKDDEATKEYMTEDVSKSGAPQMRMKSDDIPILESVGRYKLITLVGIAAAFSASLDGYRKSTPS
jgi:hypothetical protein